MKDPCDIYLGDSLCLDEMAVFLWDEFQTVISTSSIRRVIAAKVWSKEAPQKRARKQMLSCKTMICTICKVSNIFYFTMCKDTLVTAVASCRRLLIHARLLCRIYIIIPLPFKQHLGTVHLHHPIGIN